MIDRPLTTGGDYRKGLPDHREHAKAPRHLDDDEPERRTGEERREVGLDDDSAGTPPATRGWPGRSSQLVEGDRRLVVADEETSRSLRGRALRRRGHGRDSRSPRLIEHELAVIRPSAQTPVPSTASSHSTGPPRMKRRCARRWSVAVVGWVGPSLPLRSGFVVRQTGSGSRPLVTAQPPNPTR